MASIFISYRRSHDPDRADRLATELREVFGQEEIFLDVRSLGLGEDWQHRLARELDSCRIVLVVIAQGWHEEFSKRSIHDEDWVRYELEVALNNPDVTVIPVYFGDSTRVDASDLPHSLHRLCDLQSYRLHHASFDLDLQQLIQRLQDMVAPLEKIVETTKVRVPFSLVFSAPRRRAENRAIKKMSKDGWICVDRGDFSEGLFGFGSHRILTFQRERKVRKKPSRRERRRAARERAASSSAYSNPAALPQPASQPGCLSRLFGAGVKFAYMIFILSGLVWLFLTVFGG